MRTLHRQRDPSRADRLTVQVAFSPSEPIPVPGDMTSLDEVGLVNILSVLRLDSPEFRLEPGERLFALDVQTHQAGGDVPDIP